MPLSYEVITFIDLSYKANLLHHLRKQTKVANISSLCQCIIKSNKGLDEINYVTLRNTHNKDV